MLNVVSMLFTTPNPDAREHGERPFWREHGADYVRRFFAGAARHIKEPYTAFLMTDDPAHCPPGVHPLLLSADPNVTVGWWAKLQLFSPEFNLRGRTLYSDLDNVISGDLSPLLALDPDPLYVLDDRIHPGRVNAAALYCRPNELRFLWEQYALAPSLVRAKYRVWPHASDQAFLWDECEKRHIALPRLQDELPEGFILNSRAELEQGAAWDKTAFVYGSWDPKPHMSQHPFYAEHWRA